MRSFKLSVIATLGLLSVGSALADDAQANLRAISKRDASACGNVMDADMRTLCIAETKVHSALCYSIISQFVRDECMARTTAKK